ncbi:hydrogenase maturation protease [Denitromonas iodatirespirans]|uniref:Hydrogenase maturation protease n=1 Tax=Denitromonas iodatirespirans TaxID=2795389 RepID=A0A944DDS1_DENI1|nr:hydrogenase maturation protease [Denitromonas iodatirespirans]MBT0963627.1 hydrogenase maturation protease [Denitromonas iodatirespirans]
MSRIVVLAAGNDARGDDGIGPALAARLAAQRLPELTVIEAFQFQVEHALDLDGAEAVLFIDAHHSQTEDALLAPLVSAARVGVASHALTPAEVLCVRRQLGEALPPSWLLSVRGEDFRLGEPLSVGGERHVEAAWRLLVDWLARRSVLVA